MRDQLLGGRYRLVRQLGEGGMGQVWEAQDESLGRRVAVKVISLLAGGGSHGTEARARFLREARITARLQHPNIVTVHDLGETDTGDSRAPFLVMELVRGEGLDAKLRRGVVTLPDAARWGAQICDALADAHDAGITHRDIKPSNILVMPSDALKVLDFGIARTADPYATADRLTQTGFIVGTPPYMAPEQARGFPEARSDLYALGCLLFELITGQLPFQAPDTVGYLAAHLTQAPPTPSSVSTGIPPAWDSLVLTLLHKEPDKRYPNAATLSQALRQLDHAHVPTTAGRSRIPSQVESRAALLGRLATAMRVAHDVGATQIPDALSRTQYVPRQLDRVPEPASPAPEAAAPSPTVPGTAPLAEGITQRRPRALKPEPLKSHPAPEDDPGTKQAPTPRRSAVRTATAVTALACLLTVPVIPFATAQAVDAGEITSDEQTVQMVLFGVMAAMFAIGVLLLARNTAGRRLIAAGGIGLALQAVNATLFFNWIGLALRQVLPLAAVTAALSAILALLPSSGSERQRPR
ncbi:serine/threonine-protein kinase [Streptomyces krungchingensis]|uniref:serine/threonine-protein kinase n=1 Tax=Streptomyces krungchingensis TaxID=1565034 RepID=UPI003CEEEE80